MSTYQLTDNQAVINLVTNDTLDFIKTTTDNLNNKGLMGVSSSIECFVETESEYYNSKSSADYNFNKLISELNSNIVIKCKRESSKYL